MSSTKTPHAGSASGATSGASPSSHVLPIALGTVLGVLGLLIVVLAAWFYRRRQKRPVSEAWTVAGHSYPGSPQMTNTMTTPRSTVRSAIDDSIYANNPAYYPPADGWGPESQYGITDIHAPATHPPMPMPPVNGGSLSYTTPVNNATNGYYPWTDMTPNAPAQQQPQPHAFHPSAAILYQPGNRLSTITEKSTPPIGGGSSLANSPASQQTDMYFDADEDGSDRRTSPPIVNDNRSGPLTYQIRQPHLRRDSRDVATTSQQGSDSTRSAADGPAYRPRPPAYTSGP